MTVTVPGVCITGAGRRVAETVTESRKVSGWPSAGWAPLSGSAACCPGSGRRIGRLLLRQRRGRYCQDQTQHGEDGYRRGKVAAGRAGALCVSHCLYSP